MSALQTREVLLRGAWALKKPCPPIKGPEKKKISRAKLEEATYHQTNYNVEEGRYSLKGIATCPLQGRGHRIRQRSKSMSLLVIYDASIGTLRKLPGCMSVEQTKKAN